MFYFRAIFSAIAVAVCLGRANADDAKDQPTGPTKSSPTAEDTIIEQLKKHESENESGKALLKKLKGVSDEQLERFFQHVEKRSGLDLCLTEMIRRGGARWEKFLKDRVPAGGPPFADVALITALRRVQKKEDPLVILVAGKAEIRCKVGYPPTLQANLTNLDAEKTPIGFEWGGDYRGGRAEKWRVEIADAEGHLLPISAGTSEGGFFHGELLKYGESIPKELAVGEYVPIGKPGTYTMVVYHHTTHYIGDATTLEGMICCRSLPIKLIVEPVQIEVTDAEQAHFAELILKLPKDGTVKIVGGA